MPEFARRLKLATPQKVLRTLMIHVFQIINGTAPVLPIYALHIYAPFTSSARAAAASHNIRCSAVNISEVPYCSIIRLWHVFFLQFHFSPSLYLSYSSGSLLLSTTSFSSFFKARYHTRRLLQAFASFHCRVEIMIFSKILVQGEGCFSYN